MTGKVARHEFLVRSVGRPGTSHHRRKPGPNSASRASVICYLRFQGAVFLLDVGLDLGPPAGSRSSRAFFSCPRLRASSMACWRRARISSSISRLSTPSQAGWRHVQGRRVLDGVAGIYGGDDVRHRDAVVGPGVAAVKLEETESVEGFSGHGVTPEAL